MRDMEGIDKPRRVERGGIGGLITNPDWCYCPRCMNDLSGDEEFCPECGQELDWGEDEDDEGDEEAY